MDNNFNQQPVYQQASKLNIMELVALICAAVGFVMSILGVTLYCTCSAKATFEAGSTGYTNSATMIITIFGILIAVGGVVCAILAIKSNKQPKAGKLAKVALAVAVCAIVYGIIPTITICGYNCSLQSSSENMGTKQNNNYNLDDLF